MPATIEDLKNTLDGITKKIIPDHHWKILGREGNYSLTLVQEGQNMGALTTEQAAWIESAFHRVGMEKGIGTAVSGSTTMYPETKWITNPGPASAKNLSTASIRLNNLDPSYFSQPRIHEVFEAQLKNNFSGFGFLRARQPIYDVFDRWQMLTGHHDAKLILGPGGDSILNLNNDPRIKDFTQYNIESVHYQEQYRKHFRGDPRHRPDNIILDRPTKMPTSILGKIGKWAMKGLKVLPFAAAIPAATEFFGLQDEASAMVKEGNLPQKAYNQYLTNVLQPHVKQVTLDPSIVGGELFTQMAFDDWLKKLPEAVREEANLRLRPESLGSVVMDGLESLKNEADEYFNKNPGLSDGLAQSPSKLDRKATPEFKTAAAQPSEKVPAPGVNLEPAPKA